MSATESDAHWAAGPGVDITLAGDPPGEFGGDDDEHDGDSDHHQNHQEHQSVSLPSMAGRNRAYGPNKRGKTPFTPARAPVKASVLPGTTGTVSAIGRAFDGQRRGRADPLPPQAITGAI